MCQIFRHENVNKKCCYCHESERRACATRLTVMSSYWSQWQDALGDNTFFLCVYFIFAHAFSLSLTLVSHSVRLMSLLKTKQTDTFIGKRKQTGDRGNKKYNNISEQSIDISYGSSVSLAFLLLLQWNASTQMITCA